MLPEISSSVRAYSLYSSSKGNCMLITDGTTSFLIDAGCSCKRLCSELMACNIEPNGISRIFVTHTHTDHISALARFVKLYNTDISGSPEVCNALGAGDTVSGETAVGGFTVSAFELSHDSAGTVGYLIRHESGVTLGYATDTGVITDGMKNALMLCDAVFLESNYDPEMLRCGPYPSHLKSRIASPFGHLSNGECASFAVELAKSGVRRILLCHISPENNTPELALNCTSDALSEAGFSSVSVSVASSVRTVRLI